MSQVGYAELLDVDGNPPLYAAGVGAFLDFGSARLRAPTASGVATQGARGVATMRAVRATGQVVPANNATGSASLARMTAQGGAPTTGTLRIPAPAAAGVGLTGTMASGAARMRAVRATSFVLSPNSAAARVSLQAARATGRSAQEAKGSGRGTMRSAYARAIGLSGTVARGTARFKTPAIGTTSAYPAGISSAALYLPRMYAQGWGEAALAETYTGVTMNTRTNAVMRYDGFNFNSFAKFNGKYYAAGPGGVSRLEGTTDNGTAIDWSFVTGQIDGGDVALKRVPEIVMGLRTDGNLTVTVYPDEATSFDYPLPYFQRDVLQQVRIKPGKGMRSRYFKVGVASVPGTGVRAGIDSLQINTASTARRIG